MLAEIYIVSTVLGFLGAVAFLAGLRNLVGVRRGESLHCRKCNYDLDGLNSPEACPECGRSLRHRRAVSRGCKCRRSGRGLAWLGVGFLAVGLIAGAWWSSGHWPRFMPSNYLAWRMTHGGKSAALEASGHLWKRLEAGMMPDRIARRVALTSLRLRDTGVEGVYTAQWARFVDEAWARGLLSDAEVTDYIENSVNLSWIARTRRDGSAFLMVFFDQNSWARDRERLPMPFTFRVAECSVTSIGGQPLTPSESRPMYWDELESDPWMSHNSSHFITYEFRQAEDAAPSVLRWRVHILDANTMQPIGAPWIGERTIDIPALFQSESRGGTFRHRADLIPPDDLR